MAADEECNQCEEVESVEHHLLNCKFNLELKNLKILDSTKSI